MIYADYNGSAPLSDEVKNYLGQRLIDGPFANPNAIHYLGTKTLLGMENSRNFCATTLGADPSQVIFTSGATEGISTIFHSVLSQTTKKIIIISSIEHSAVVNTAKHYEALGFTLIVAPVTQDGVLDMVAFHKIIADYHLNTALVAIMAANNETGVIQPYQEVNALCKSYQLPYLCDTTQFIGKTYFNFKELDLDYAVCSGHKLGALTGTGILLVKNPEKINALIIGGGQENGRRGGTQHYLGNETLAIALQDLEKHLKNCPFLTDHRRAFEKKVKTAFPDVVIIGENAPRLSTTTYIALPGIHGQAVQIELESHDIFVTTSSACSDNMPVTSRVLKAMNVADPVGRGVVRVSLGLMTSPLVYETLANELIKAYTKLSKVKSY